MQDYNIEIHKIVNPLNVYLDDLLKTKFQNLYEISNYEIDNYPLYLNTDACTLIIKDKGVLARDPTPDEVELFCRPRVKTSLNKKSNTTSSSNSNNESTDLSDKEKEEVNKKKVTVKNVYKNSLNHYKDKGLKITVKKNIEESLLSHNVIEEK